MLAFGEHLSCARRDGRCCGIQTKAEHLAEGGSEETHTLIGILHRERQRKYELISKRLQQKKLLSGRPKEGFSEDTMSAMNFGKHRNLHMETKHGDQQGAFCLKGEGDAGVSRHTRAVDSSTLRQSRVSLAVQRNNVHVSGGDREDGPVSQTCG